ncbi:MAG: NADH-quinone oxidoreductase subunit H [Verrucomicrobia bacterium]|nr:NADH-quinone oxidoreductase subunit H [Verrucomicrobiota bacterium]
MNSIAAWLLTLAGAAALIALGCAVRSGRGWLISSLSASGFALGSAAVVLTTGDGWTWQAGFHLGTAGIHLRMDAVSALFLALLAVLGGAGALYSREYWNEREHPRSAPAGRLWWSSLLLSMALVLVSSDGLQFLIAWELFALSAWRLIILDSRHAAVRQAGWLYFAASHAGTLCLFGFFASLAARTGSWDLGPLRDQTDFAPLLWLALIGFGLKAGLFPLHIWLPSAHANAPSHISAILSGVAIKMGIYGLVRFTGWLPLPTGLPWVVASLGVVSAVLGVVFALGQHDLKRLLAYHSVENIGIILIGLGFALLAAEQGNVVWGQLALAGGLLHVWNHGLFKALLFLGAGSVLHATGTREMSRLGGLWRTMPWTTALFGLGAAAIAGLPPLNGFVSEFLVYLGLFEATLAHGPSAWAAIPAAVLLGMTGALALACFVKVCGVVFLGAPRSPAAEGAHECGRLMRTAMGILAAACVAIGLLPVVFWPAVARVVEAWQPAWTARQPAPAPLAVLTFVHVVLALLAGAVGAELWRHVHRGRVGRAVTWDCGYAAPTARMQYTASSFAEIITGWFAWILRPVRHEHPVEAVLPVRAMRTEHTPETVLERIIEPAARGVLRVSTAVRRLQHGRVQSYLLYTLIGLAALALLIVMHRAG